MPRLVTVSAAKLIAVMTLIVSASSLMAVDTIEFRQEGEKSSQTVTGRILLEALDGGVMLLADDGRIWRIQPTQILRREGDETELEPISADQMKERMLAEMPNGFNVYQTSHYVIVHNTNEAYVRQVGTLFEQLYRGFFTFWKNQRWDLPEPEFPLVALVFANHRSYLKHGTAEIGDTAKMMIGYYHFGSNRMTTFNVPNLERNIATIIHEATHQLAYNCGMQHGLQITRNG